jgi:hypothetical protein
MKTLQKLETSFAFQTHISVSCKESSSMPLPPHVLAATLLRTSAHLQKMYASFDEVTCDIGDFYEKPSNRL